ncbi:glucan biosynthesis protein G [Salipiger manganoxidans]|uniref:glucan biosynthesis protein n=1 Tax=Salipiger marinus TaxID=555512 RepID=UPI001E55B8BC|nr:glucan biosynthesis protein G [Salipiger manganoxidans]MCD1619959.1 glucan biosynthesis protein G [Salipiger manganoxidans]
MPGNSLQARPSRRRFLTSLAGSVAVPALLGASPLIAQDAAAPTLPPEDAGSPFSFDLLSEGMARAAMSPPRNPEVIEGFLADLDYDGYQRIRFDPERARWREPDVGFRLSAFHLGWLFETPVHLFEVVDGQSRPMTFGTQDFDYSSLESVEIPADTPMPGVAGFRLNTPLNRADIFDELVAFLGASYFRALGRGTLYGLSARGLAVNTGLAAGEEFPRFSDFWLERPQPGAETLTLYAALESQSVTGAYRFIIRPGTDTQIDVTARLYLRNDIEQLGIAPLTSMFLYGGADAGEFDDFRPAVHDSEALVLTTRAGATIYRPLNNPPRLASSYFGAMSPKSFGLVQRTRDFSEYLDAEAHYEKRPTLMVEPLGDWGEGTVRLVEIPSKLEANDNIVAYWIPDVDTTAGAALEFSYRLSWGLAPEGDGSVDRARVVRTRVGKGGVSGMEQDTDRRKFVIDFEGGLLGELPGDAEVEVQTTAARGEIAEAVVSRISGTNTWRLVLEVEAPGGTAAELSAELIGYGHTLTETWTYQWVKE